MSLSSPQTTGDPPLDLARGPVSQAPVPHPLYENPGSATVQVDVSEERYRVSRTCTKENYKTGRNFEKKSRIKRD